MYYYCNNVSTWKTWASSVCAFLKCDLLPLTVSSIIKLQSSNVVFLASRSDL